MVKEELTIKWQKVQTLIKNRFGENLDIQTILFIIGLQELGKSFQTYSKEQKLDLIHIGICTVLQPFGYYKFVGNDDDGWPHFKNIKKLSYNVTGELQEDILKKAIINYFTITSTA